MKLSHRRFLVALTATAMVTAGLPAVAVADPEPTTGVELVVGQDKFVGLKASYDPAAGVNEGVAALRDLRGEMWDKNPPFVEPSLKGRTLQEVARSAGFNTKQEYQNGFGIDEDLNWIAIQRAFEQSAGLGHTRPDGSSPFTATRGRQAGNGESIGKGYFNLRHVIFDGWGRNELPGLIAARGEYQGGGHLHQMINPKNRAYGFGAVTVSGKRQYAAQSSETLRTPANPQGGRREQTIYRAAKSTERPTGITSQPPAN